MLGSCGVRVSVAAGPRYNKASPLMPDNMSRKAVATLARISASSASVLFGRLKVVVPGVWTEHPVLRSASSVGVSPTGKASAGGGQSGWVLSKAAEQSL